MFGNDYKKQCEILTAQLAENCHLMEDLSKHSDKLHIVKFVLNNADQFLLDGEFVLDESEVVYGAHNVSFSEAVMFKAGKEAAQREFDIMQANSEKAVAELTAELARVKSLLDEEKQYSQLLASQMADAQKSYSDKIAQIQRSAEADASSRDSHINALQQQLNLSDADKLALESELAKWKAGELVNLPFPIVTTCGVITEE